MNQALSLRLTLSLGERCVAVALPELVALLGSDAVARLTAVLFRTVQPEDIHSPDGERGGRGSLGLFPRTRTKNGIEDRVNEPVQTVLGEKGCRGKEGIDGVDNLASYLADALDDSRSLRFFRLVAANVPGDVIRECLTRARDIPRRDIRRSRAAVFTKLVLPHLEARRRARTNP